MVARPKHGSTSHVDDAANQWLSALVHRMPFDIPPSHATTSTVRLQTMWRLGLDIPDDHTPRDSRVCTK